MRSWIEITEGPFAGFAVRNYCSGVLTCSRASTGHGEYFLRSDDARRPGISFNQVKR